MNDATSPAPGPFSVMASMARTRLELASMDLQTHLEATFAALALGFAALVLGLVAFAFVGVAVIAFFWDTHRLIATVATTLCYSGLALSMTAFARARWRSRPAAFAGVLRELALDAEAMRRPR